MSKATIKETIVSIPTYKLAKPEKSPLFIEKERIRAVRARSIPCLLLKRYMMKRGKAV